MNEAPEFFVPAAEPEQQESVYAELARICHCKVPTPGARVYSITYVHDGEEWTATVGKPLTGIKPIERKRKGQLVPSQNSRPLSDPAIVLAIFPGNPYMVVTNHRIAGNVGSAWENPFMAGRPKSVTHFSPSE